jgi:hypothetical protein
MQFRDCIFGRETILSEALKSLHAGIPLIGYRFDELFIEKEPNTRMIFGPGASSVGMPLTG